MQRQDKSTRKKKATHSKPLCHIRLAKFGKESEKHTTEGHRVPKQHNTVGYAAGASQEDGRAILLTKQLATHQRGNAAELAQSKVHERYNYASPVVEDMPGPAKPLVQETTNGSTAKGGRKRSPGKSSRGNQVRTNLCLETIIKSIQRRTSSKSTAQTYGWKQIYPRVRL